ncbi:hypothetical protein AVEN_15617-1 [Araneus ventricosus]|uniref:Uncharacterized protein n=1 Tax=Araneus ventricosus TaxID=182803 RepID=A0A4Y2G9Y5_ARAVE|nr:hypothetical protein AVEN_15617-1 [Araneus ventricosus]
MIKSLKKLPNNEPKNAVFSHLLMEAGICEIASGDTRHRKKSNSKLCYMVIIFGLVLWESTRKNLKSDFGGEFIVRRMKEVAIFLHFKRRDVRNARSIRLIYGMCNESVSAKENF